MILTIQPIYMSSGGIPESLNKNTQSSNNGIHILYLSCLTGSRCIRYYMKEPMPMAATQALLHEMMNVRHCYLALDPRFTDQDVWQYHQCTRKIVYAVFTVLPGDCPGFFRVTH